MSTSQPMSSDVATVTPALDQSRIDTLKSAVRGDVILPDDSAYDDARRVYNAMIDRHPALIVRCVDVADVIATIDLARETGLDLSIRGGSHNVTGFAVNDGGIVLDLSRMRATRVDPAGRTVRAEGGVTWGDLYHATYPFGLAVPAGIISTTGIAGLTLGGGIGHLTRTYGLSCDCLVSADVVAADGRLITASATENADLFWALRGGGGNFGVVTSFEFSLHPAGMVFGGPVFYAVEHSRDALRLYRDFMKQAPEDVSAFFAFLIVPTVDAFPEHLRGKRVCAIVVCSVAPVERAQELVRPLREFGPPLLDLLGPLPLPVLNSMFDFTVPVGKLQNYWKADFIKELSDELIDAHVRHGPQVPSDSSTMHIYPTDGAAHRLGPDDTAFSYRDADFVHVIAAMYPNPADTPRSKEWVRSYWEALHPHSAGGAYVNFMMDEGDERIKATYRGNYDRLAAIKRKYDPGNLFHMNQNITPAK